MVLLVHRLAVGGARAMRDPGARAGAHDRLERGDEPARRALDLDHVVLALHVHVGLAIGDDQHLVALQVLAEDAPQRLRAPGRLALVASRALRLQVSHQRLQVASNGPQLLSCTILRLPSGPESPATGFAETCSGPSFNCSTQLRASLSPGGGQRTVCGQVGLANARWPVRSQSPMAKMRSPCMMRSK